MKRSNSKQPNASQQAFHTTAMKSVKQVVVFQGTKKYAEAEEEE